jgi:hypothetical protein
VIFPFPIAVTEKSPAIASAELDEDVVDVDELDELDELDVLEEVELDEVTD